MLVIDYLLLGINKEIAEAFIMGSHHKKIRQLFIGRDLNRILNAYKLINVQDDAKEDSFY